MLPAPCGPRCAVRSAAILAAAAVRHKPRNTPLPPRRDTGGLRRGQWRPRRAARRLPRDSASCRHP